MDLLRSDPGSCSEMYLTSNDGENRDIGVKVEEFTDTEEEGNSHAILPRTTTTEIGVSFMSVC